MCFLAWLSTVVRALRAWRTLAYSRRAHFINARVGSARGALCLRRRNVVAAARALRRPPALDVRLPTALQVLQVLETGLARTGTNTARKNFRTQLPRMTLRAQLENRAFWVRLFRVRLGDCLCAISGSPNPPGLCVSLCEVGLFEWVVPNEVRSSHVGAKGLGCQ